MEFISKGYSGIFVTSEEDKTKVLNYFEKHESFEFNYLSEDQIIVVDEKEITNKKLLFNFIKYNGKFEPDLKKFIEYCAKNNIKCNVVIASNDDDVFPKYYGCLIGTDEDVILDEFADIIASNVFIRGIDLEHYKREFKSKQLIELIKVFINKHNL